MKTNKKIIIYSATALLLFSSCKKNALTRLPQNQASSETFWTSANDVRLATNGCYALMSGAAYDAWYYDGFADNCYDQYPWESAATDISAGNITSALNPGYNYEIIRRTNYFLDNVDKVTIDEALKKRYIAEVRFIRAFKYFYLTSFFGDVPLLISSENSEESLKPAKQLDVLTFVTDELNAIAEDLPLNYDGGTGNESGRITKGAVYAFLARVSLLSNQWDKAATAAKAVIDLNNYELFSLSTLSDKDLADDYSRFVTFSSEADKNNFYLGLRSYEQLFWLTNETNKEFVLKTQFLENSPYDQSSGINTLLLPSEANGWSSITPTVGLVNSYWKRDGSVFLPPSGAARATNYNSGTPTEAYYEEFKNRDTRLYASILFTGNPLEALGPGYVYTWGIGGNNNTKTGYNFRKLVDPAYTLQWNAPQSYPIIRFAEVLLTYAEAQNEKSGPDNTVYDALDKIRDRVRMPRISRTQTQVSLREIIRNERRIELAVEGLRYFDIRRWNIASSVMKDEYSIMNKLVQARKWEDRFKLLPYPQNAIDRNINLVDAQKAKGY